ncbi:FtsB family cell division protein [Actinoplanes flavus]|uniref:Septum formation initiator family protein n=1 Tax=Actinoplanes flavus TaxID=2820290 RepID=A0ABS3UIZ3_9ACTN|nr:septum formation initiator family protein [Actinoplanes flavus]MBO3738181.1 septum formation initiator family protein [Actinoplanes flavus]
MAERRTPSGQGPARRAGGRPTPPRTRNTGPIRVPAARRTPSGSGGAAAKRTEAPRPRALTGRATVLIALVVALALAYTYPVRVYLKQEAEIAEMERAQAVQRAEIAETAKTLEKWNDPEYLRIQARERIFYVRPGETPLLVVDDKDRAARTAAEQTPAAAPDRWYDTLWSSVQAANAEPQD